MARKLESRQVEEVASLGAAFNVLNASSGVTDALYVRRLPVVYESHVVN